MNRHLLIFLVFHSNQLTRKKIATSKINVFDLPWKPKMCKGEGEAKRKTRKVKMKKSPIQNMYNELCTSEME